MALTNATTLADYGAGIGTQGATLKVDATNKRVGVGTDSPAGPEGSLQVGTGITFFGNTGIVSAIGGKFSGDFTVGGTLTYEDVSNIDAVGIITAQSHVSIADSILHTGDTDTSIRFPSAGTFTVETNGSERFRVTDSLKEIKNGSLRITSTFIQFSGDVSTPSAAAALYRPADNEFAISTSNTERLRVDSAGRVGIGTNNPLDELHVNSSSSNVNLRLTRDLNTGARITGSNGVSPAFIVETIASGTATERVRVTSDGNVSIQNDSGKFTAGTGDDLQIYHNGTVSRIDNNVGVLQIRNLLDDSDISLQTDNGSGGAAEYVLCDGSSGSVLLKHYGTTKLTTVADGVDFDGTGSIKVPVGTTAERPTGVAGDFRYNSTLGQFEGYSDSWGEIGGSGGVSETDTSVSTVNPTGVGSFAVATHRSAAIIAQIDQTGSGFQVGRYLMIHDGTNVTVVEESAVATGDMLGSFDGAIVGSNAEFRVTMASAGIATVTTKIDTVTV